MNANCSFNPGGQEYNPHPPFESLSCKRTSYMLMHNWLFDSLKLFFVIYFDHAKIESNMVSHCNDLTDSCLFKTVKQESNIFFKLV